MNNKSYRFLNTIHGKFIFSIGLLLLGCTNIYAQNTSSADTTKANRLYEDGVALIEDAQYDSSSSLISEAAEYYKLAGQWSRVAECLNRLGSNYRILSNLDRAETYSQKVIQLLDKYSLDLPIQQLEAYNNLGLIDTERNDFDQAISLFQKALGLTSESSVPAHKKALLLGNLGSVYDERGSYDQALDYYSQGVNLLNTDGNREHRKQLAKLYNYSGVTYVKKGLFNQALQFYERELNINLQLYGESHPSVAGGYNNIGGIYYRNGDIGEAIVYFKKAASATELIFEEKHPRVGLIYNNIGAAYYETGDYTKAIEYLRRSAEIKRKTQGAHHPDLALTYNNIGSIYTEMGKDEEAIDYLQNSLDIRLEALGKEHPVLSNNYNSLGMRYLNINEPGRAIPYFRKGVTIAEQTRGKAHPYVAEGITNLAKAYRENGNFAKALTNLREAEKILSTDGDRQIVPAGSKPTPAFSYPTYAVDVISEKGKILYEQYLESKQIRSLKSALAAYTDLSDLLDQLQLGFQNEESKLLMSSRSHEIYEGALRVSFELYEATGNETYLDNIFFFSEKSKSRVILELLNNKRGKAFAGIPDSLLTYENNLRQNLSDLQQELQTNLEDTAGNQESYVLQDSIFTLHRRLNTHLEFLKQKYPKYHTFKYRSEVPDLSQVRRMLAEKELTLLEYFYGEDSSWALVINADEIHPIPLPHIANLPEKIGTLNRAIAQKQDSLYLRLGHELYQALVEPVEENIGNDPLLIVPDGALNLLPFGTLLTDEVSAGKSFSELPYLLNNFPISYTPSISLSSFFNAKEEKSYPQTFMAFAPGFSDKDLSNFQPVSDRNSWEPLPSTKYEVEQIAASIEGRKGFWTSLTGRTTSRILTGDEATEVSFKSQPLNRYRYLHLATHAFTSDTSKGRAGIVFHPEENTAEDGILYSEEIYGLNLENELIVLSACETGTGQVRAGEGIIGLSRAFQYAGAENLMVSLWNVEDRSTARLMINFYENLRESNGPQALQSAKQKLITTSPYAHPRYWAPFVFIGNQN